MLTIFLHLLIYKQSSVHEQICYSSRHAQICSSLLCTDRQTVTLYCTGYTTTNIRAASLTNRRLIGTAFKGLWTTVTITVYNKCSECRHARSLAICPSTKRRHARKGTMGRWHILLLSPPSM